ncbi:hypothetical protein ABMB68_008582 [Bradyrhizobium sp. RT4a]
MAPTRLQFPKRVRLSNDRAKPGPACSPTSTSPRYDRQTDVEFAGQLDRKHSGRVISGNTLGTVSATLQPLAPPPSYPGRNSRSPLNTTDLPDEYFSNDELVAAEILRLTARYSVFTLLPAATERDPIPHIVRWSFRRHSIRSSISKKVGVFVRYLPGSQHRSVSDRAPWSFSPCEGLQGGAGCCGTAQLRALGQQQLRATVGGFPRSRQISRLAFPASRAVTIEGSGQQSVTASGSETVATSAE